MNRTLFRNLFVLGVCWALATAFCIAVLATPGCAFAQSTLNLPAPGQAPALPPGLPAWVVTLITIVFTLAPVALWVVRVVGPLLQSMTRKTDAAATLLAVEELAASVVAVVEVRIKPKKVAALEDGIITPAEAEALQKAALDLFFESAPEKLKTGLAAIFGSDESVRTYVVGLLERANAASKVDAHPAPIPEPAPTV